jgi:hypothetical protein
LQPEKSASATVTPAEAWRRERRFIGSRLDERESDSVLTPPSRHRQAA